MATLGDHLVQVHFSRIIRFGRCSNVTEGSVVAFGKEFCTSIMLRKEFPELDCREKDFPEAYCYEPKVKVIVPIK